MRRTVLVLVFVLSLGIAALPAAASSSSSGLAPLHLAPGEVIPGQYIVVMEDGTLAAQAVPSLGVEALHVYEHALNGFAATLSDRELEQVRRHPGVAYVEQDQVVSAVGLDSERVPAGRPASSQDVGAANQFAPPSWGLDRIDQRYLPLDNWYRFNQRAGIADVYIVDTGIDWNHPQLRKTLAGYDAFGGNSYDCNGHGTHVAGTAASDLYGVAKDAWKWSVRVLNCSGSGSYAGIIAGTDWVRQNITQWPGYRPIANYSLGGGYSAAVNTAIDNLSNSGVFVAVAAGNGNSNACNFSPASASTAFTVASSDRNDVRRSSSNHGSCVDLYAPGVSIVSTWLGGGTATLSGTSMASPHAAGVAAMYKTTFGNHHWSSIRNWLNSVATPGVIIGNPPGTPNRLLYTNNL